MRLSLSSVAPAVMAVGALGLVSTAAPVAAAPVPVSSPINGEVTVAGKTGTWPSGSTFTGTFDEETGALAGDLAFTKSSLEVTDPASTVTYQIEQAAPLKATVAADGSVSGTAAIELHLLQADLGGNVLELAPCDFGPIQLDLTGTLDDAKNVTLTDADITIAPAAGGCSDDIVRGVINERLAGPASATFVLTLPGGTAPSGSTTPVEGTGSSATPPAPAAPTGATAPAASVTVTASKPATAAAKPAAAAAPAAAKPAFVG